MTVLCEHGITIFYLSKDKNILPKIGAVISTGVAAIIHLLAIMSRVEAGKVAIAITSVRAILCRQHLVQSTTS